MNGDIFASADYVREYLKKNQPKVYTTAELEANPPQLQHNNSHPRDIDQWIACMNGGHPGDIHNNIDLKEINKVLDLVLRRICGTDVIYDYATAPSNIVFVKQDRYVVTCTTIDTNYHLTLEWIQDMKTAGRTQQLYDEAADAIAMEFVTHHGNGIVLNVHTMLFYGAYFIRSVDPQTFQPRLNFRLKYGFLEKSAIKP